MKKFPFANSVVLIFLLAETAFAGLSWDSVPKLTLKHNKSDGDPVNVILIGTREDLTDAMTSAGWSLADKLTIGHLAREVESIVINRPYDCAPVSSLYLFGRKHDIAFEQREGISPKHRHHVRFWSSTEYPSEGKPAWFGAATYDISLGLGMFGSKITHHIDPDIDLERDKLIDDLMLAGKIKKLSHIAGLGLTFGKRNAEGDLYFTDGEITLCSLAAANRVTISGPIPEQRPAMARHKLRVWKFIKNSVLVSSHKVVGGSKTSIDGNEFMSLKEM